MFTCMLLCRNPCNGARPIRVGRQGGVPAEQALGRVEAGDYMWLRAFCPQACYAGGPGPFRYLLYKDANRHMRLPTYGRRNKLIDDGPISNKASLLAL